jgi:diadenosine tetraphosphate (Ap4A) HIT family hydrolase
MLVLYNRTSYDLFEGIPVREHLMLIPKLHHVAMDTLSATERKEYIDLLCKYEAAGYSMYGRALTNMERSMEHIHLHLLKLDGRRVRNLLYIDKPYLLLHGKQRKPRKKF